MPQANVYVRDPDYAWIPAVLESQDGNKAICSVPQYKNEQSIMSCRSGKRPEEELINLDDYPHKVLPLQNIDNNGNLMEYPDMVKLPYLHEVSF